MLFEKAKLVGRKADRDRNDIEFEKSRTECTFKPNTAKGGELKSSRKI